MLSAIDSFVEYLADLDRTGMIPVHWRRVSADDPQSGRMKVGALNIAVLMVSHEGSMVETLVSLDLLSSNERQALTWSEIVRDKLIERQYIPLLDYAQPDNPMALGRSVFWSGDDIAFDLVRADSNYFHLNATFPIRHAR